MITNPQVGMKVKFVPAPDSSSDYIITVRDWIDQVGMIEEFPSRFFGSQYCRVKFDKAIWERPEWNCLLKDLIKVEMTPEENEAHQQKVARALDQKQREEFASKYL